MKALTSESSKTKIIILANPLSGSKHATKFTTNINTFKINDNIHFKVFNILEQNMHCVIKAKTYTKKSNHIKRV